jgi:septal ring factor EnvC (AmiA/AmiB activator)
MQTNDIVYMKARIKELHAQIRDSQQGLVSLLDQLEDIEGELEIFEAALDETDEKTSGEAA